MSGPHSSGQLLQAGPRQLLEACPDKILAVDLDGTLVHCDMLRTGLITILRRTPQAAFGLAWALLRGGRPGLKRAVALRAAPTLDTLPYNDAVIGLVHQWRAAGRRVVLATAADALIADAIARHLGVFDAVHASGPGRNLKGPTKAAFLVREYGARGFVYAGDSRADLHIWRHAAGAVLARDDASLLAQLRALGLPVQMVHEASGPDHDLCRK